MKEKDLRREAKDELKERDCMVLKENLVKLTENLFELQRSYKRTEEALARSERKIAINNTYINKAIGVLAAISFVAALAPVVIKILDYMSK